MRPPALPLRLLVALVGAIGGTAAWNATARAAELDVCPRPECAIRHLRDAIAKARAGDVIRVGEGTYAEGNLVVDKPLRLDGGGRAILDGQHEVEVLTIRSDDVVVEGFTVRRSGTSFTVDLAAIRAERAHNCRIQNNRLEDNFFGIYLAKSTGCRVTGNTVVGPAKSEAYGGNAIHVWDSGGVEITNNRVSGHRDGIYLEFVRQGRVADNTSEHNARYGLHFMYTQHVRYTGNLLRENGAGAAVMYSKWIEMTGNRIEDNWGPTAYGLLLKELDDSFIARNVIAGNSTGLFVDGANRLSVQQNDLMRNGWAVRLLSSSMGVVFAHNNFIGNAFDVTTNGQSQFNSFLENYWSDYRGYDLDHDGVGDVPARPVRWFAVMVENYPEALVLLRSPLVSLMDAAERLLPSLTPQMLADHRPLLRRVAWSRSGD